MLFIFSTPVLIRHLWQLKTVVFLHWCRICALLLGFKLRNGVTDTVESSSILIYLNMVIGIYTQILTLIKTGVNKEEHQKEAFC